MRGVKRSAVVFALVLVACGVGLVVRGIALPRTHVTAVPVIARAVSSLSGQACDNGDELRVVFDWHGAPARQVYDPDCSRNYAPGDRVRLFVASDDPNNLGPSADWILSPDEHDPFDAIGPNGMRGFVIGSGVALLVFGAFVVVLALVRNRRSRDR